VNDLLSAYCVAGKWGVWCLVGMESTVCTRRGPTSAWSKRRQHQHDCWAKQESCFVFICLCG